MENASKALIMAASVLIAIVIIGAFVLMMSNLTNYQGQANQEKVTAQIAEFNNVYLSYNRKDVRGSDMISLMNRVVDYNARKNQEGYTKMGVTIDMNGQNSKLAYDGTNRLVTQSSYKEDNIHLIVGKPSSLNNGITDGKIREIEAKYQQKYASQIVAEISNIESIATNPGLTANQKNDEFDKEQWLPKSASRYGGVSDIYEDALWYYEYVQFKRAYFDCINTEHDKNTGRIIRMEFKCTGIGV